MLYLHKTLATAIVGITLSFLLAALLALWPATPAYADDPVTPNVAVITTTVKLASTTAFINVPITLTVGEARVSSLGFRLSYDQNCLGIADYVNDVMLQQSGFVKSAAKNAVTGALETSIWDNEAPINTMTNGEILIIKFTLEPSCRVTTTNTVDVLFSFDNVTFADDEGVNVPGAAYEGTYTLDINQAPTGITLTPEIDNTKENVTGLRKVATLAAIGDEEDDEHTFTLASSCTGTWDNQGFVIVGAELKTDLVFDYEAKSNYPVCVEVNDGRGGTFVDIVSIHVGDVNEAPTAISLDNNLIVAGTKSSGDVVGYFTTTDPDDGQTHTYSLVAGAGDTDNSLFTIDGNSLRLGFTPAYNPAKPIYKIRVQTQDNGTGALTFAQQFNIIIVGKPALALPNHPDVPYVIADSIPVTLPINFTAMGSTIISATMSITYNTDCLTYTAASGWQSGMTGSGVDTGGTIDVTTTSTGGALRDGALGYLSFLGKSTCTAASSWTLLNFIGDTRMLAIDNRAVTPTTPTDGRLVVIKTSPRGDCNGDGNLNAGDFTATVRELWDASSELAGAPAIRLRDDSWLWTPLGTYAGSAMGCDSNADRVIAASDLICTVLRYFGASSCGAVSAASMTSAVISVPSKVIANAGETVDLPVSLTTNGSSVASIAFTLQVDPAQFVLYDTDTDEDGIPDMVSLHVPNDMIKMVMMDLDAGTINIAAFAVALPMSTLKDGVIATIRLTGGSQAVGALTPVQLTNVSLGDEDGGSVEAEVVLVEVESKDQNPGLFLPMVTR